jgi:hypothetical protein
MFTKIAPRPQFRKVLYKWTPQEAKLLHSLKNLFEVLRLKTYRPVVVCCWGCLKSNKFLGKKLNFWNSEGKGLNTQINIMKYKTRDHRSQYTYHPNNLTVQHHKVFI